MTQMPITEQVKPSSFNLRIDLAGGKSGLINTLSGAVDIFDTQDLDVALNQRPLDLSHHLPKYLFERCYLIDSRRDEAHLMRTLFDETMHIRQKIAPLKAVLIFSFACNLRCGYCWQRDNVIGRSYGKMTAEHVAKAYEAIEQLRRRIDYQGSELTQIQLLGGEPLLEENRPLIAASCDMAKQKDWPVMVTSNGKLLAPFREFLESADVAEVQVTLDGFGEMHEKRRYGSKFDETISAIDDCLQGKKLTIKLRTNLDRMNIASLPKLADEIIDRQWHLSPRFYAYLAPVRDSCISETAQLHARPGLLRQLLSYLEKYPQLEIFHLLGWSGFSPAKMLSQTGKMPLLRTCICDANQNQFVFSPDGKIHVCNENAHASSEAIGRYWPSFVLDEQAFASWYHKTANDYPTCDGCALLPICSGGCQLIHRHPQAVSAYCKMMKECFAIGMKHVLEEMRHENRIN